MMNIGASQVRISSLGLSWPARALVLVAGLVIVALALVIAIPLTLVGILVLCVLRLRRWAGSLFAGGASAGRRNVTVINPSDER